MLLKGLINSICIYKSIFKETDQLRDHKRHLSGKWQLRGIFGQCGMQGLLLLLLTKIVVVITSKHDAPLRPTNLLFIMFDDLRPELSVYGQSHVISPNFERLGNRSVVFDYAYCQISVCNPSRDSMLTGLRPDTVGTYGFQSSFRPHMIFPTQLARSGYKTAGYGKILHFETNDRDIWNYDSWENNWWINLWWVFI
jgi:hypothetical protein